MLGDTELSGGDGGAVGLERLSPCGGELRAGTEVRRLERGQGRGEPGVAAPCAARLDHELREWLREHAVDRGVVQRHATHLERLCARRWQQARPGPRRRLVSQELAGGDASHSDPQEREREDDPRDQPVAVASKLARVIVLRCARRVIGGQHLGGTAVRSHVSPVIHRHDN